jgi:hypothetical protein
MADNEPVDPNTLQQAITTYTNTQGYDGHGNTISTGEILDLNEGLEAEVAKSGPTVDVRI